MTFHALRLAAAGALAAALTLPLNSSSRVDGTPPGQLTAHEWGTFTSIAGRDGRAMEWLPLTGSTDLPAFVEHFRGEGFKCGLGGTVRMETPVLYLYSPRETTVSVHVSFAKGLITEWYPHASAVTPKVVRPVNNGDGSIRWDGVRLLPDSHEAFAVDQHGSHYYAARETSATPVRVMAGDVEQNERFLFYRGVSSAPLPIEAVLTPEGRVRVENRSPEEIPAVMLIESRDGKLGYRQVGSVRDRTFIDPPAPGATRQDMLKELDALLAAQGLYADEARAMIATWRDSWFEEGTRLLYVLPSQAVNDLLPLSITPRPVSTIRVFLGRLELLTPATRQAVEQAFAAGDRRTLDRYRRFLQPILEGISADSRSDPARMAVLSKYLGQVYSDVCGSPWPSRPE